MRSSHHCHEWDGRGTVLDFHALQCLLLGQRGKGQAGGRGGSCQREVKHLQPRGSIAVQRAPRAPKSCWWTFLPLSQPSSGRKCWELRDFCLFRPSVSSGELCIGHLQRSDPASQFWELLCAVAGRFWYAGDHRKWRWKWQKEILFIFENCDFHVKCQGLVLNNNLKNIFNLKRMSKVILWRYILDCSFMWSAWFCQACTLL